MEQGNKSLNAWVLSLSSDQPHINLLNAFISLRADLANLYFKSCAAPKNEVQISLVEMNCYCFF